MSAVYFIQAGETGPIKIGQSNDPVARLASLQTGHYEVLTLLGLATSVEERELHERFAAHALAGEWFQPHPDVVAAIEQPMEALLEMIGSLTRLPQVVANTIAALKRGDRDVAVVGLTTLATSVRTCFETLDVDAPEMTAVFDTAFELMNDRITESVAEAVAAA